MNNKIIIIIGIIILIIATAAVAAMLTSADYERIEITPNGTSIEVPAHQTKYDGEIEGVKIWNWHSGVLVAYNSNADKNIIKVTEMGFDTLDELIKNGENQSIDGFTCYVLNADELFDIKIFDVIKVNSGKLYCIPLSNETTGDNIIICSNDRDMAVHMAGSLQYKNVYPNSTNAFAENITGELLSKANDTNFSKVKSQVEEKTGINLDDAKAKVEQYTGKLSV